MFGTHDLALFVIAGLLLNITPGADTLYIVGRSASQGARAGAIAALGIGAGCFVHVSAAALGLSALLSASALGFAIVKYVGAAYLFYLGVSMIVRRRRPADSAQKLAAEALSRVFWGGFLTNALNPKVALFFLAFLPQFIDAAAPDQAFRFLVLGAWFAAQSALFLAVLVGITGLLRQRARSSIFGSASAGRWLQGLGGLLFLGLAARLARTEAPVP